MIDALLGEQPHSSVFYRSPAASRSGSCSCAVPLLVDGVSDTLQRDMSPAHGLAVVQKTEDIPTPGLTATPPPKGGQERPLSTPKTVGSSDGASPIKKTVRRSLFKTPTPGKTADAAGYTMC